MMKRFILIITFLFLIVTCKQTTKPVKNNIITAGTAVCESMNSYPQVTVIISRDEKDYIRSIKWVYIGIYLESKANQEASPELLLTHTWDQNIEMNKKKMNYLQLNNEVSNFNQLFLNYTDKSGKTLNSITADQIRLFNQYNFYYLVEDNTLVYVATFKRDYALLKRLLSEDYLEAVMIHDQEEAGINIIDNSEVSAQKYVDSLNNYPTEFAQALGIDKQVDMKCSKFK